MAPRRHANGHGGGLMDGGGGGNELADMVANGNHQQQQQQQQQHNQQQQQQQGVNNGTTRCCIPSGECLRVESPIHMSILQDAVKVTCNNESCPVGQFMHRECFEAWEQTVLTYLKGCGRARSWSERQRHQNLWTKKGYDLAFKACGCRCGRGHLKKDLDWMPPGVGIAVGGHRPDDAEAKKKKRRNRQNTRPSLAVSAGPPGHGVTSHAVVAVNRASDAQIIESSGRGRAASLSSSTGSSSPPATSEPSVSPLHQSQSMSKKKNRVDFFSDRARQSCGANGIFSRRLDFSAFNSLPRTKLNSYHIKESVGLSKSRKVNISMLTSKPVLRVLGIGYGMMVVQQLSGINAVIFYSVIIFKAAGSKLDPLINSVILAMVQVVACLLAAALIDKMEDEGNHGNDDTRCFILSTLAALQWSRVACVLCRAAMLVFDRYPLVDGTFFLSPRQHSISCAEVKVEGRTQFLSAVCMSCLEGSAGAPVRCRSCTQPWVGSSLVLGTMYSYDIFAAMPCCTERIKCNSCQKPLLMPHQRLNFYSDYSRVFACPHCRALDAHFVKPLSVCYTREPFQLYSQWP